MIITDITVTKRGRYALFCDEEFLLSIDENTFSDYSIKKGMNLNESLIRQLKEKSEYMIVKAKAYELLSYRDHTKKELLDKLLNRYDEYTSLSVIEELTSLGYIDENKYICDCLDYLFQTKGVSIQEAKQYLIKRGITRELINEILSEYDIDDSKNLRKVLESRYISRLSEQNGYSKVFSALMRRGFRSSDIKTVLSEYAEYSDFMEE